MTQGRFITLEGGEGAGKSTQLRRLAAALRGRGFDVVETREPGGSAGAEEIRELLIHGDKGRWDAPTEALLISAARRDHLVRTVWPALARGCWVLCDRFADSTLAYQGYGQGLDLGLLDGLYRMVAGAFAPDLTMILDLPVEVGLRRATERQGGGQRFESMDQAFHQRLRQGFLEIAARDAGRCRVIDADGSEDEVARRLAAVVAEKLGVAL
jgi:dTMP kinase